MGQQQKSVKMQKNKRKIFVIVFDILAIELRNGITIDNILDFI